MKKLCISMNPIKGLFTFLVYLVVKVLSRSHVYSYLMKKESISNLELLYVIPFKYIFFCRFGEAFTVESALLRKYYDCLPLSKGSVLIDIGAHIGTVCIRFAKMKQCSVIAIEPERTNMRYLRANIALNKVQYNIKAIRVAVGERNGNAHLYLHGFTGHSIYIPSDKYEIIKVVTLDTLYQIWKDLFMHDVFIKINAEGAELDILKGSLQCLKNIRGLCVAVHHSEDEPFLISAFLKKMGFSIKLLTIKGNELLIATKIN